MGLSVFPAPSTSTISVGGIPANGLALPSGISLRNTYTSSQTGLSFPVDYVFAVVIG